jgi:hypothetical protein
MKSREEILKGIADELHNTGDSNYISWGKIKKEQPELLQLLYQAMQSYADQCMKEFEYWKYEKSISKVMYDGGLYYHYNDKDITYPDLLTIYKKERGIE